jgi:sec-independent protein translocase protein TatC
MDAFTWRLRLAGIIGLAFTSPVVITEIWLFIAPGLKKHERRFALPAILSASILFYIGGAVGVLTLPFTLKILQKFGGEYMRANYTIDRFISFFGSFILGLGIVFESPVVLILLAKLGIVSYKRLAGGRKYAIVITALAAAVITPTGDPITMMAFAIPMYMLFEITLLIIRFMKPPVKPEASSE